MATRFDELESERERRRNEAEYLPGLLQQYAQSAPPQPWMRRPGPSMPQVPLWAEDPVPTDTFDERFNPRAYPPVKPPRGETPRPTSPGTRERFGDPTKVIADASGAIPQTGFDPEGEGYDYESARAAGINPDATGHWPSRDPKTGLILKGRRHPTFTLTEQGEEKAGHKISKRDGRYYSSPISQSGKKSDEQPYAVELPPGFTLEPTPEGLVELPKGFTLEPEGNLPAPTAGALPPEPATPPNAPAPMAGMSQWSPDEAEQAREVAALRMRRSAQPPEGRQEGRATEAIEGVLPAAEKEALRFMEIADRAVKSGDIPPAEAAEVAMLATPASAAYRTGRAIAQARRSPAERAQIEAGVTSIPQAASGGPTAQMSGRALSGAPFIGAPLRNAAERSTAELQAAGTAAAARPTGTVVDQKVAGSRVRDGLANAAPGSLSPKLEGLLKKSDEDIIGSIITMAGSKGGADIATLAQLRRAVPARAQPEVQSAIITRLGQGPTGEFDPKAWLRNYGSLSDRGKNVLFGLDPRNPLRRHLDAIESVARRAPTWQQFQTGRSSLGTAVGVVGLIGAAAGGYHDPMTTLGIVVPSALIARGLAKPAVAAPMAQWSRAYERMARSGGAPQALAAFTIATRNLANSMDMDFSVKDFLTDASKKLGLDKPEGLPSRLGYPEKGIVPYTLTDPKVDYRKIFDIGE